jgi:hypothetical protein
MSFHFCRVWACAWKVFSKHFPTLLLVYFPLAAASIGALVFLVRILAMLITGEAELSPETLQRLKPEETQLSFAKLSLLHWGGLVLLMGGLFLGALLTKATSLFVLGTRAHVPIRVAFLEAAGMLGKFILLHLVALVVFGFMYFLFFSFLAAWLSRYGEAALLWLEAAARAGILILAVLWWTLPLTAIMVVERQGVSGALQRNLSLTRGRFGSLLWLYFVLLLFWLPLAIYLFALLPGGLLFVLLIGLPFLDSFQFALYLTLTGRERNAELLK